MRRELVMLCALLSSPLSSFGSTTTGTVVGITDGDTITILMESGGEKHSEKVRLVEIDAPEKSQGFGQRSKQSLSEMCYRKYARVVEKDRDRWGRILGRVYCIGPQGEVDASLEQVKRGMAWFYVQYGTDPGVKRAEDEARRQGAGLWAEASQQPPWEFRHEDKSSAKGSKAGKGSNHTKESKASSGKYSCENSSKRCAEMGSCEEAKFYMNECSNHKLDRDKDGIPCENVCL